MSFGEIPKAKLQRMNDVIWRRGPDGEGSLHTERVGLAMRRLAIIDLTGGWQPVYNEDETVAVVFNGEIYNYKKLRRDLEAAGHRFKTQSDTEVIVHLYEDHGEDCVSHLEGMFAFALWDFKKQTLLLARDRLGIKPLFVARTAQGVLFGSEIKSLIATGLIDRDINPSAVDQFLNYTYIPAPHTIYKGISKVLPGTTLTIDSRGNTSSRRYWKVPDAPAERRTEAEWQDIIERSLRDAVESHLVSDVPVGAFLSGGVDSGLMVALMAQSLDRPVETFTVGFRQAGSSFIDERVYAREIAARYNLKHHEIDVEPRVTDIIHDIVAAFDEPFADDSVVPTFYVCKVAAQHLKVALTGLGGDELFAGYRRHLGVRLGDVYGRAPRWMREWMIDPVVRRLPEPRSGSDLVDHLKRFSRASSASPASRYQDSMSSLPVLERAALLGPQMRDAVPFEDTTRTLTGAFESFGYGDSVDRALKTDLQVYLPDDILTLTDRLSMWHSLELRVPFLDHRLVERAMAVPSNLKVAGLTQKRILKNIAAKYLPRSVIEHRKQGFEAPMGAWLRGPLRELMNDVLDPASIRADGIFDATQVERLKREHLSGARKHSKIIFSLLMFRLWMQSANEVTLEPRLAAAN